MDSHTDRRVTTQRTTIISTITATTWARITAEVALHQIMDMVTGVSLIATMGGATITRITVIVVMMVLITGTETMVGDMMAARMKAAETRGAETAMADRDTRSCFTKCVRQYVSVQKYLRYAIDVIDMANPNLLAASIP
jgi:hypothetical protein